VFSPDGTLSRVMTTIFDILIIGILWFICSLPVITIGASTTAAYYTMAKVVRFHAGYIRTEFLQNIKSNLRQSLVLGIIAVLALVTMVVDLYYLWNLGTESGGFFIAVLGVSFIIICVLIYIFPFLSRFSWSNLQLIKMAGFAAFKFLPITIGIIVVLTLSILGIYFMPWALVVIPGVYMYLLTYPMEYVMRRFMKDDGKQYWFSDKKADSSDDFISDVNSGDNYS